MTLCDDMQIGHPENPEYRNPALNLGTGMKIKLYPANMLNMMCDPESCEILIVLSCHTHEF